MTDKKVPSYIQAVINNMPADWLKLTTHRLDIYNEELAKTEFLAEFEGLYQTQKTDPLLLKELPTAYDYIRLGHPLSSILEWTIAKLKGVNPNQVITFSSRIIPLFAILRKNLFDAKKTVIYYEDKLPEFFDENLIKKVYQYHFELVKVNSDKEVTKENSKGDHSTVFLSQNDAMDSVQLNDSIDFYIQIQPQLGSVLIISGSDKENYTSKIQHVRRRETISMTPFNSLQLIKKIIGIEESQTKGSETTNYQKEVIDLVHKITATNGKVIVGSSGLSVQYAIMMGLIDNAIENHPEKKIKIIVPPNCYGGTNDQARRVAACNDQVEIMDLPVDGDHDMVQSTDIVLNRCAQEDSVPYIIAEIPTNPRVEVPDLEKLKTVLSEKRKTTSGKEAIAPVFILDQTFCPNVQFLSNDAILSPVQTISYVSGSKFPSGGKCTAGYCAANEQAEPLMAYIEKHLILCDNEATAQQIELLAEQMPSMNQRIEAAYKNTRAFVQFIQETLPEAKINFVSDELAKEGFTPSVFSLDLPTKGNTHEERENYKRKLNLDLINRMITQIPDESKYCVSYGQLKGCYWTIPATSTQGTTKEEDKDYIARVSVSPDFDIEKHKEVFREFVTQKRKNPYSPPIQ